MRRHQRVESSLFGFQGPALLLAALFSLLFTAPLAADDYTDMIASYQAGDAASAGSSGERLVSSMEKKVLGAGSSADALWQYLDACYIASMQYMNRQEASRAVELRRKAAEASRLLGEPFQEASKYLQLAEAVALADDREEILRLAKKAVAIIDAAPGVTPYTKSVLLMQAGITLVRVNSSVAHDEAFSLYSRCLSLVAKDPQAVPIVADAQYWQAVIHKERGDYANSLNAFNEAERLFSLLGYADQSSMVWMNLTELYYLMHDWNKTVAYADRCMPILRSAADAHVSLVRILGFKAEALVAQKKIAEARSSREEMLSIGLRTQDADIIGTARNDLALLELKAGNFDAAEKQFREVLADAEKRKDYGSVIRITSNLSSALSSLDKPEEALLILTRVAYNIPMMQELSKPDQVGIFWNIGALASQINEHETAMNAYTRAITLVEEIRRNAPDMLKREYLSAVVNLYHYLGFSQYKAGSTKNAIASMDWGRARFLAEKIDPSVANSRLDADGITALQKKLPADTAILAYSGMSDTEPLLSVITRDSVRVVPVDRAEIGLRLTVLAEASNKSNAQLRGIAVVKADPETELLPKHDVYRSAHEKDVSRFDSILNYYRTLLSAPAKGTARDHRELIAKTLYAYLVAPALSGMKGLDHLVIIPDGILGFLPFETLRADSSWLVERYRISYAQSLQLYNRTLEKNAPSSAHSLEDGLFAMGNPSYAGSSSDFRGIGVVGLQTPDRQKPFSPEEMWKMISSGSKNLGPCYESLGITGWAPIPGTGVELKALSSLVRNTRVLEGSAATESGLKNLSLSGELKKYPYLHFAVHGLVVPEYPELAALVLSRYPVPGGDADDGYLRVDEAAGLALDADLVTLSACQTGLGKIYGGEGVVGLTQAFMRAGARAVSVSLWQVADESTAELMKRVYSLASGGSDFSSAWRTAKLEMIKDGRWQDPFYWAPFVYYGK